MYISLYVVVNTFYGGRQPQNKLMRLRTFKKGLGSEPCEPRGLRDQAGGASWKAPH